MSNLIAILERMVECDNELMLQLGYSTSATVTRLQPANTIGKLKMPVIYRDVGPMTGDYEYIDRTRVVINRTIPINVIVGKASLATTGTDGSTPENEALTILDAYIDYYLKNDSFQTEGTISAAKGGLACIKSPVKFRDTGILVSDKAEFNAPFVWFQLIFTVSYYHKRI